jgi:hypothetical protein
LCSQTKIQTFITLLDQELKNVNYLQSLYEKYALDFIKRLLKYYYLLTIFEFTLRSFIICIFVYDVFSHKIIIIYNIVWLFLFIYIIKFSLEILKNDRILYLTKRTNVIYAADCVINPTNFTPLNDFIHVQITALINNKTLHNYLTVIKDEYMMKVLND